MAIRFDVRPIREGDQSTSWGVYCAVPTAGGDAAMLCLFESRAAADELAAALQRLVEAIPALPRVMRPNGPR